MSVFTFSGSGWIVAPMARAPHTILAVRSTRAALWSAFSGEDPQVTRPWLASRAAPRSARWLATSSPSSDAAGALVLAARHVAAHVHHDLLDDRGDRFVGEREHRGVHGVGVDHAPELGVAAQRGEVEVLLGGR